MKKILVALLVLGAATAAFAAEPNPFASYNKPGNVNAYASIGYVFYPEVSAGLELILGEFSIAKTVPFDWGLMARAGLDFFPGGVDWGIGALATLHLGLRWNIDFYAGLGLAFWGPTYGALPLALASYNGVAWMFSKNVGLLLEAGYLGWAGFWGIGLEFKI